MLILGAGSNGLMLAQLARQNSAGRVIIVDPIAYRRRRALDSGIDYALDPGAGAVLEQVYAVNDNCKPDIVIVTPSNIQAMQQGIELVGPGGTVLLFAPPPPTKMLPLEPNVLFFSEITLRTSYSAGPYETRLALDMLRDRRINAEKVITHRFALQDAAQAFQLVAKPGDALKAIIVVE